MFCFTAESLTGSSFAVGALFWVSGASCALGFVLVFFSATFSVFFGDTISRYLGVKTRTREINKKASRVFLSTIF